MANRDVGERNPFLAGRNPTNRWTGATGSVFRIKRDPAKLLAGAVARSTPPFGATLLMEEIEFAKVVNNACRHPGLFTFNGTVTEVLSFLEGFAMGANVGGPKNRMSHSKLMTPFRQWCENRGVEVPITRESASANDIAILNEFARLYTLYANEVAATDGDES